MGRSSRLIVKTDRLYLREFEPGDASHLFALNSNPDVIRYTGDSPFLDLSAAESFVRDYDQYQKYGFGRWAVILQADDRFIGYCGLRKDEVTEEVDLGFRFFAESWSRGFATEAGRAALSVGFERYGLDRVIGRSMRENRPSITVLQKLGMEFSEVREESGLLWLIYSIERANWQAITSSQTARDP